MDLSASSSFEERLVRRLRDATEAPPRTALRGAVGRAVTLRSESRAILFLTGLLVGVAVMMLVQAAPAKMSALRTRSKEGWRRPSFAP